MADEDRDSNGRSTSPYHRRCFPPYCDSAALIDKHAIGKMTREDLEDRYIVYGDENLSMKKQLRENERQILRLQTALARQDQLDKKGGKKPASSQYENTRIEALESLNKSLQAKVKVLKQQLMTHSYYHAKEHKLAEGREKRKRELNSSPDFLFRDGQSHSAREARARSLRSDTPRRSYIDGGEGPVLKEKIALMEQLLETQREKYKSKIALLEKHLAAAGKPESPSNENLGVHSQKLSDNVEMIKLRRQNQEQSKKIANLTEQQETALREIAELQAYVKEANERKDKVQKQLDSEREKLREAQSQLTKNLSHSETIKVLEEQIRDLQKEKNTLKDTNEQLLKLTTGPQARSSSERLAQESKLRHQISSLEKSLKDKIQELDEKDEQIAKLESLIKEEKEKQEDVPEVETSSTSTDDLENKEKILNEELRKQCAFLERRLNEADTELQELRLTASQHKQCRNTDKEREQLEKSLNDAQQEIFMLKKELSALQAKLDETKSDEDQHEDILSDEKPISSKNTVSPCSKSSSKSLVLSDDSLSEELKNDQNAAPLTPSLLKVQELLTSRRVNANPERWTFRFSSTDLKQSICLTNKDGVTDITNISQIESPPRSKPGTVLTCRSDRRQQRMISYEVRNMTYSEFDLETDNENKDSISNPEKKQLIKYQPQDETWNMFMNKDWKPTPDKLFFAKTIEPKPLQMPKIVLVALHEYEKFLWDQGSDDIFLAEVIEPKPLQKPEIVLVALHEYEKFLWDQGSDEIFLAEVIEPKPLQKPEIVIVSPKEFEKVCWDLSSELKSDQIFLAELIEPKPLQNPKLIIVSHHEFEKALMKKQEYLAETKVLLPVDGKENWNCRLEICIFDLEVDKVLLDRLYKIERNPNICIVWNFLGLEQKTAVMPANNAQFYTNVTYFGPLSRDMTNFVQKDVIPVWLLLVGSDGRDTRVAEGGLDITPALEQPSRTFLRCIALRDQLAGSAIVHVSFKLHDCCDTDEPTEVSETIEVGIGRLSLKNPSLKLDATHLYVEYSLLGYCGPELETDSVPKSDEMLFNHRKKLKVTEENSSNLVPLLDPTSTKTLRFNVLAEPCNLDRSTEVKEIGFAEVNLLREMVYKEQDVISAPFPVFNQYGETLGSLSVTLIGCSTLQHHADARRR